MPPPRITQIQRRRLAGETTSAPGRRLREQQAGTRCASCGRTINRADRRRDPGPVACPRCAGGETLPVVPARKDDPHA